MRKVAVDPAIGRLRAAALPRMKSACPHPSRRDQPINTTFSLNVSYKRKEDSLEDWGGSKHGRPVNTVNLVRLIRVKYISVSRNTNCDCSSSWSGSGSWRLGGASDLLDDAQHSQAAGRGDTLGVARVRSCNHCAHCQRAMTWNRRWLPDRSPW